MNKVRRTEERIIAILQEHGRGMARRRECADLCRRPGVPEGTFPARKAALNELLSKAATPVAKGEAVALLKVQLGLSEQWACPSSGADCKIVH